MSDPTTNSAFDELIEAYRVAVICKFRAEERSDERATADRHLTSARAAIRAALADAEARGRAAALAEVDAAAKALWANHHDGEVTLSLSNSGWYIEPPSIWTPTPDDDAPTPTAAILAAAASLGGDA